MLYMLFSNSLVSCNPRFDWNTWKLGKASGYETRGGIGSPIEDIWTNPTI